jgi:hypothetical protein
MLVFRYSLKIIVGSKRLPFSGGGRHVDAEIVESELATFGYNLPSLLTCNHRSLK